MVNNKYDYIVIGGGLNSLIAAALLAKKNNSVILFESNNSLGGMASTYEFSSGFRCNLVYDYIKWLDERVLKELNIKNDEFEGCRVTPHVYTTIEEIDRFSDAMEEIIKNGVG